MLDAPLVGSLISMLFMLMVWCAAHGCHVSAPGSGLVARLHVSCPNITRLQGGPVQIPFVNSIFKVARKPAARTSSFLFPCRAMHWMLIREDVCQRNRSGVSLEGEIPGRENLDSSATSRQLCDGGVADWREPGWPEGSLICKRVELTVQLSWAWQ